jgi:hypothetical protein
MHKNRDDYLAVQINPLRSHDQSLLYNLQMQEHSTWQDYNHFCCSKTFSEKFLLPVIINLFHLLHDFLVLHTVYLCVNAAIKVQCNLQRILHIL